jgi:PAS domain S-box-containing protein
VVIFNDFQYNVFGLEPSELERQRIEEALGTSETYFRKIAEKSIVGVYLIQDGLFQYVNPKMAEIFGYDVNELLDGRGPKDVVHDEDWPEVSENLRQRVAGELESINYRFRGTKSSGELVYIEVYGSRTDYLGRPAVIGTILDISERVQAEHDLQMQLHRFQALYHIAMAMTAENTLRENLTLIVEKCRELLQTDVSLIAIAEENLEKIRLYAQSGFRYARLDKLPSDFLKKPLQGAGSVEPGNDAGDCFRQFKTAAKRAFHGESLVTGLAIPVRMRKSTIGILCVGSRCKRAFSDSETDVLLLMSNIASLEMTRRMTEEQLAKSESQLRFLSAQLLRSQEDQKKRLAQELHDGIGQSLSAIKFKIESLVKQVRENPGSHDSAGLDMLVPMIQGTVEEVQRIAMDLRPFMLDDLGLIATLRWFFREFQNTYSDVKPESKIGLTEAEIPEPLKIVIFRIVQEALNNVARHSRAKHVHVALRKRAGRIELIVRDSGVGIDADSLSRSPRRGFGLASMQERAELSGGTFGVQTGPHLGTFIRASWPFGPE